MSAKAALSVAQESRSYDEELHKWFIFWTDCTGNSDSRVAGMLRRSKAAVSQYRNKKHEGNLDSFERDLLALRKREEDIELPVEDTKFCKTKIAQKISDVFQVCEEEGTMGLIVGPAGVGKTETVRERMRRHRNTKIFTADITSKSCGAVLYAIAKQLSSTLHGGRNAELLYKIVDQLEDSRCLLIIDECHFLSWEAIEVVRKIYDSSAIGVCFIGMHKFYSQMRGSKKSYLYDQILSRFGVQVNLKETYFEDVEMLIESIHPGLNKACRDYLFKTAMKPGKYRLMTQLLKRTIKIHEATKHPLTDELFKKVDKTFFAME